MAAEDSDGARTGFTVASALYASELGLKAARDPTLAGLVTSLRVALGDGAIGAMRPPDSVQHPDAAPSEGARPGERRRWALFLRDLLDFVAREALVAQDRQVFREVQELRKGVLAVLSEER